MKKEDRITVRLPESLREFEALGFGSMTDFVKTALEEYILRHNFEVAKCAEVLENISDMITVMEAERDYSPEKWSEVKDQMLEGLYAAAKTLASTDLMKNAPGNIIETDALNDWDEEGPRKVYKYQWAL